MALRMAACVVICMHGCMGCWLNACIAWVVLHECQRVALTQGKQLLWLAPLSWLVVILWLALRAFARPSPRGTPVHTPVACSLHYIGKPQHAVAREFAILVAVWYVHELRLLLQLLFCRV